MCVQYITQNCLLNLGANFGHLTKAVVLGVIASPVPYILFGADFGLLTKVVVLDVVANPLPYTLIGSGFRASDKVIMVFIPTFKKDWGYIVLHSVCKTVIMVFIPTFKKDWGYIVLHSVCKTLKYSFKTGIISMVPSTLPNSLINKWLSYEDKL
ncbi:hypothetical protein FF38_13423 [Lucilia cuprina]|uniref:Uncharacterized protein n=1 Tax=Lucilia cuprina TaxID=7375 RepID=A0A0L0CPZ2_LUCCU|nr:hypothetical protein FF38_13423 [Lucilia cuprina]